MGEVQSAQFQTEWEHDADTTPVPVNQFIMLNGLPSSSGKPGEYYIRFGYANPPALLARPDGSVQMLPQDGVLKVNSAGFFAFTRDRLVDLHAALTAWLESDPHAEIPSTEE